MSLLMRSSCKHLAKFFCQKMLLRKKKNIFKCSPPQASFIFSRGPHIFLLCMTAAHLLQNVFFCLNYHWWCDKRIESQQIMFASRTGLIKASLGCCDAPVLIFETNDPCNICPFPRICCFPSREHHLESFFESSVSVGDLFLKLPY